MWIKICGVSRPEDVSAVIHAGADAIGFNFFPGSKRYVSVADARRLIGLAKCTAADVSLVDFVGVFVDTEAALVRDTVHEAGLSVIQIHGEETVEQVVEIHRLCPDIPLVRAYRADPDNLEYILADIDRLAALVPLAAVLLDAYVPGEFGGTGRTVNLSVLQRYFLEPRLPLILAGGLTPENVAEAAAHSNVWGIDTASGVESSPGIKDAARIGEFVRRARGAVFELGGCDNSVRIGKSRSAF